MVLNATFQCCSTVITAHYFFAHRSHTIFSQYVQWFQLIDVSQSWFQLWLWFYTYFSAWSMLGWLFGIACLATIAFSQWFPKSSSGTRNENLAMISKRLETRKYRPKVMKASITFYRSHIKHQIADNSWDKLLLKKTLQFRSITAAAVKRYLMIPEVERARWNPGRSRKSKNGFIEQTK